MESENRGLVDAAVERILVAFGETSNGHKGLLREGLQQTPMRVADFWYEFLNPPKFKFTMFEGEQYDEIVLSRNIPFYSVCEHHMAPFFGVAHVGYLPDKKIVGISKLARTVDMFARKLQNQERLTQQIAGMLNEKLTPRGVAVVIKARHLCQEMRGIQKPGIETVTSKMIGVFKDDLNARTEFLKLITI